MNPVLPVDPQAVLGRVREYLAQADLSTCTTDQVADQLGAPFGTIRHRLETAGTTWSLEKTSERTRRLHVILDRGGKLRINKAAHECGYSGSDSFLRFFKRVIGMGFTDYRLARQRGFKLCRS